MASVAILATVAFLGNTNYVNALRFCINAGGRHTCDIYQPTSTAALAPILAGYDVVFPVGFGASNVADTTTYAYMLHNLYKQGKPMIVADSADSADKNFAPSILWSGGTLSQRMGMYAHTLSSGTYQQDYLVDLKTSTDPILGGLTGMQVVSSNSIYQTGFRIDSIAPQAEIIGWANAANPSFNSTWGMILKCPKNAMSLLGTPFPANAAHVGYAFGGQESVNSAYMVTSNNAGITILNNLIDWLVTSHRLAGTVQDGSAAPLVRKLHVHATDTGKLIGTTTSAADGSFELRTATNESMYIVVDDASGTGPSGIVVTDLTPVPFVPAAPPAPTPMVIHHGIGVPASNSSSITITCTSSYATNAGDLLVAIVYRTSDPNAVTPAPVGWTLVGTTPVATGPTAATQYVDIYTKTATLGDVGVGFIFRQATAGYIAAQVVSMFGTAGTPVVDTLTTNAIDNSTDRSFNFPSVNVAANTASIAVLGFSVYTPGSGSGSWIEAGAWDDLSKQTSGTRIGVGVLRSPTAATLTCVGKSGGTPAGSAGAVSLAILTLKPTT